MKRFEYILSGYSGINRILRVQSLPRLGVTELVQNADHARACIGGNAMNIACGLAALGLRVLPVLRGGYDYKECGLEAALEEAGVCREALTLVERDSTSCCYLVEDAKNDHLTLFYPGAMDGRHAPESIPREWFEASKAAVLAVGSRQDNELFLNRVNEVGLPLIFGMRADFDAFPKELLRRILTAARLIFMNEEECRLLLELYELGDITELFGWGNAELIVETLGARGSLLYEKTAGGCKKTEIPVMPGDTVVDATGAGDAYMAGFLYGMSLGKAPATCALCGSTAASFVVERTGCLTNVPDEAALLRRLATGTG